MRKGFWIFLILLATCFSATAQYANAWIVPGQNYYRIPIAQKGVYKLTYADLQNAGVPVNSVDPRQLQIFHRGIEQAIVVAGQDDAVLNPGDYVEFFGKGNDGTRDQALYKPANLQPHNYYNLYSDTTAYFLTWPLTPALGKRVAEFSEANVPPLPAQTFHTAQRLVIYKDQYAGGNLLSDVLRYSHFDEGEGWTGVGIRQSQSIDYVIDQLVQPVTSAGTPQLELLLAGRDQIPHTAQIYVGPASASLRLLDSYSFNGFATVKLSYSLAWSDLDAEGRLTIRLVAPPDATNRLQFSASYIKVTFPQTYQLAVPVERTFQVPENAGGKSYVEWTGANASVRVWDVTQAATPVAIGTQLAGSTLQAVVNQTQTARELFVFSTVRPATIKRIAIRPIPVAQANYIVISHRDLMQPAGGYSNPVKAYAGYRASVAGGGYDTLVVTTDQLYNQFNYGETSPLAIYEFMRYMVGEGTPRYLFLIGKGRDVSSGYHRIVNPGASVVKDLVPTAGSPASDMLFTIGLGASTFEPAVPTGRLAATTPAHVASYLTKVIETETLQPQLWQKKGLHLSGGIQPNELVTFREYVDGFKSTAEQPLWGATINTIAKRDPNPVELINISDQVNAGVNLVTFFGHSSSSTIDIDIGFATDPTLGYANAGKYPVFLINGCNAGNFFSSTQAFGEDWINAAGKGARAFIAHSSFGYTYTLQYYSSLFYQVGFTNTAFVGKGIGDVQKEVARQYMLSAADIMSNITQIQQMVLLGDPAVKLFPASKPDYTVTPAGLSLVAFDNKPITVATDSFAIRIINQNLGLAIDGNLPIRIIRTASDGAVFQYDALVAAPLNTDTVFFTLPRIANGGGTNQFKVILDPDNVIEEINETNNEATLQSFIATNATFNLFPKNFAIVSEAEVTLLWQATDLRTATREYEVELDSVPSFNSALRSSRTVSGSTLAQANFALPVKDSTAYYWRTRFKTPQPGESNEWVTSSFSVIQNSPAGWAQLKAPQLNSNALHNLIAVEGSVPFAFKETQVQVSVSTFGRDNPLPYTEASIKINGSEYNLSTQGQPCRDHTFNVVAFNKTTAIPYAALPFNFQDPRTCGREPQVINSFLFHEFYTGAGDDLVAFVDAVAESDSVVMFGLRNFSLSFMPAEAKQALTQLGVSLADLNGHIPGEPVVILGKKGAAPGTARFIKSSIEPTTEQVLAVSTTITGKQTRGEMKSPLIGPAVQWMQVKHATVLPEASDVVAVSVVGVRWDGTEVVVEDEVTGAFDLSFLSASEYPYVRLVYATSDEINQTPAPWKYWLVLYESPAEGILVYQDEAEHQQVQEGEGWQTTFGFTNISAKAFAANLPVTIEVINAQTQHTETQAFDITAPLPGATTTFHVTSATIGKAGSNTLNVMVNNKVVPEAYYENNFMALPNYLRVQADATPPVLQVLVDGRLLRNNDFVAAQPLIVIELLDENQFLLKTDTLGFTVLLGSNCNAPACTYKRINLSSPQITWYPATATTPFRIEYRPSLQNGLYELSVQGADARGNLAGSTPYRVAFQVEQAATLQWQGVYPNPSQGRFAFQFVLTGAVPDHFQLEIFSAQGARLQRFGSDDLLQFFVGTNELVWDGTDASGGFLPPGVYFYDLQIGSTSTSLRERGKLVLIR
ncbi:MAG: hypothetical protein KF775_00855 [Cyclobacteriaceae bacterium]|nr:hypothetical protein [Cyclobacteriaceae bacterium]